MNVFAGWGAFKAPTVLAIIKRSRKGVEVAILKNKTGFEDRKISRSSAGGICQDTALSRMR